VSDQDVILDAIEDAQRILAEHIEPTSRRLRKPRSKLTERLLAILLQIGSATWSPYSIEPSASPTRE
jgi:hypothetical protein